MHTRSVSLGSSVGLGIGLMLRRPLSMCLYLALVGFHSSVATYLATSICGLGVRLFLSHGFSSWWPSVGVVHERAASSPSRNLHSVMGHLFVACNRQADHPWARASRLNGHLQCLVFGPSSASRRLLTPYYSSYSVVHRLGSWTLFPLLGSCMLVYLHRCSWRRAAQLSGTQRVLGALVALQPPGSWP